MGNTRVRGDDPGKFERKKDDSIKKLHFFRLKKMMGMKKLESFLKKMRKKGVTKFGLMSRVGSRGRHSKC